MANVAILGAGPSGLVSAKEALENGLRPTVFEKHGELGGVWNPDTGAVWDTMHANISKFTTVYGDSPYPDDTEMFPSSASVFQYLNNYADKWGLREYVRFESQVVLVEPLGDQSGDAGWKVTWKNPHGVTESQTFSGVIVATGIFAQKNIPEIPGLKTFPGMIIHSNEYKSAKGFEGLNILTIGGSFSGSEIAADVSNYAKTSYHSFRRPFWILRRYLPNGEGFEIPVDLLFYTRKFYSQPPEEAGTSGNDQINIKKNKNLLSLCSAQQKFESLKISEGEFSNPINAVISDHYLPQTESGNLIPIRSSIKQINGSQIEFENGTAIDSIDAIIFGTGFAIDNSFFPESILTTLKYHPFDRLQPLILFQECAHPKLQNLFFVGMYKGPYFAVMEQQARLAARVLGGRVQLPSLNFMLDGLRKEEEIRDQNPRPQFPHSEYVLFADTISKYAKSFPDLDKLQSDQYTLSQAFDEAVDKAPKSVIAMLEYKKQDIANKFMTAPVTPVHYNFVKDPKTTLNHIEYVDQVLKQFAS